MRRTCLCLCLIAAVAVTALVAWRTAPGRAQPADRAPAPLEQPAAKGLPLAQVILFSSGVGYFQREGQVEGNARVDLSFPAGDVNDLLKSLVLEDRGQGKIGVISYDGMEPLDKTLKSFALDLTYNPTFGQLLNQARGEKVEVTLQTAAGAAPGTVTGVIVGMESQVEGTKETHQLNLLCAEGVRCVPLAQVQRMRFLNSALDGEFRRALEVLAASHNAQKRGVSLHFAGDGKRPVRVGYVVESPIWKTSYRLVMDKKTGKLSLQGWAVVENTTDEDWRDVRMALVASRPISFVMDLYQPLFLPRPTVEPERFASLRPPEYQGALTAGNANLGGGRGVPAGGLGALGGFGGGFGGLPAMGGVGALGGGFNQLGGMAQLGGQFGQQGGQFNRYQAPRQVGPDQEDRRLTYEELQQRRKERQGAKAEAKKVGSALAAIDPTQSIDPAATGEEVGDGYRYVIDQKVSLPRQKSALLPLVNQPVAGTRVSIYNPRVEAKFPLLGLKFKNTTGQPLTQGPVTVFEGGTYAGDARVMDLQPGEERLLAYAIDQGLEVKTENGGGTEVLTAVRINKGVLAVTHKLRETKTYLIKNRSSRDRLLVVEQPLREDWKLVEPARPAERSRDVYRFEWKAPAGKADKHEVAEEKTRFERKALADAADRTIALLLNSTVSSPKVKEALRRSLDYRAKILAARRDLSSLEEQLKTITADQARMRANLGTLPKESQTYKRTLEKFDRQEPQIEKLQAEVKEKQEARGRLEKELSEYLAGLTAE